MALQMLRPQQAQTQNVSSVSTAGCKSSSLIKQHHFSTHHDFSLMSNLTMVHACLSFLPRVDMISNISFCAFACKECSSYGKLKRQARRQAEIAREGNKKTRRRIAQWNKRQHPEGANYQNTQPKKHREKKTANNRKCLQKFCGSENLMVFHHGLGPSSSIELMKTSIDHEFPSKTTISIGEINQYQLLFTSVTHY